MDAEAKSRKTLRRALKINDGALLIVTGCYASLEPEQLAALDGVDLVVPISEQERIPALLRQLRPPAPNTEGAGILPRGLTASIERTRATVKVQDGCNLRCAFCAVTLARGALHSRPMGEVVAELRALAGAGIVEIVLTGIRLDAYGLDFPGALDGSGLADLLDATREVGIMRLRLSSLEPIGITPQLVEQPGGAPDIMPSLPYLPAIGRRWGIARNAPRLFDRHYRHVIDSAARGDARCDFHHGCDGGIPGGERGSFCRHLRAGGGDRLHQTAHLQIFASPSYGSRAMGGQIPAAVKDARSAELFALERRLFSHYAARLIGTPVSVLVEQCGTHGSGHTPHYLRVCAPFAAKMQGR